MQCSYCKKVDNPEKITLDLPNGWVSIAFTLNVRHSNEDYGISSAKQQFCCNDHAFNYMKEKLISLGVTQDDEQSNNTASVKN